MISVFATEKTKIYTINRDSNGQETLSYHKTVYCYLEKIETSAIDKSGVRTACDGILYARDIRLPYPDMVFELDGKLYQPITMEIFKIGFAFSKFKVQEASQKWDFL